MKNPSSSEITKARNDIGLMCEHPIDRAAMADWEGKGWHHDELYYGILIGLRIAENRKARAASPAVSESR